MSIPISIDQLSRLGTYEGDSTEMIDWFNNNGFKKIIELSRYIEFPVFKEGGFSKHILRSWMGRKVLSELSNIIIIPDDKNGVIVFNTIENLLEIKEKISIIDILKSIPNKEINLDLDRLILVISSWRDALAKQQNLVSKLNKINTVDKKIEFNKPIKNEKNIVSPLNIRISVEHRENDLFVEFWKPQLNESLKDLIIFMPGLGGNIENFRWLGDALSKRGWPFVLIDHEGSNSDALRATLNGKEALPGGAEIYLYRIKDLHATISAHKEKLFGLDNDSYILMGHSLGSLISFLYEGKRPVDGLESRCENSLSDFALTNLSKLIQCQLSQIPLPKNLQKSNLKGLIGFNSFGSLIWPNINSSGIEVPVLLIGGTYDLITPLISEQFKVFLATSSNTLSRFLIVEGASHFSPIRITKMTSLKGGDDDVFKINENFIGTYPFDFQNLALQVIVEFLNSLEKSSNIGNYKNQSNNINFHILDLQNIKKIMKN